MKFNKMRILCAVITVVMLIVSAPATFAQDVAFDLSALGVTSKINMDRDMNAPVRRDEFAQMVVSLMGYDGISATDDGVFTDIADSQYKDAICLLYEMNFVSGASDKHFKPSNNIRYSEACKILVDVLGYTVMVSGKTLENYTYVAGDIGITDGVAYTGEYVSMNGVVRMLYNCLDINRMTKVLMGDAVVSYEISNGNTLRKQLSKGDEEIVKLEGIVTADKSTYLHQQIPSLKSTQIQINDKVYTYDGVAPIGLVGRHVELYAKNVGDKQVITSIQPTKDNVTVIYNTDDVIGVSYDKISLQYEDGTKDKYTVNGETIYLYNLRADREFVAENLKDIDDANVVMIDNNDDEIFDVVYILKYSDAVVERTYAENYRVYFKEGYKLDGNKYIDLDPTEQYVYTTLTHADGTVADFSEIKEDTVLSVAYSENNEVRLAVIGGETVTGVIDGRDDYEVIIGDKAYEYNIPANDLQIGRSVTATLNFKEQVVMVEYAESEDNFAYVYKVQNATSGFGFAKAQLLIPSPVSARTEVDVDLDEGGESTTTRKLFCRNEDVLVYDFASKVRVETKNDAGQYKTTTYSSSNAAKAIEGKVVTYRLDNNGKIAYVTVLNPIGELQNKTYNAGQQIFGKSTGLAFGITNSVTKSICIPKNTDDVSEDDLKVFVELLNSTAYTVQGYAYDEDTYICDLILVQATMLSGTAGDVNSKSDVGLVTKRYQKLGKDGEELIGLTMLTEEGEKDFTVSNLISSRNSFLKINEGDFIAYSLDNFENLNGYALLQDKDSYFDIEERSKATFSVYCGIVNNIKYNYPSVRRNMWVTTLYTNLETGASATTEYDIIKSSAAPVFLIEDDNYSIISVDDIQFGDRVFVATDNGTTRAVVVKR